MAIKDSVWSLAEEGVAGAVLEMPLRRDGAMPPLRKAANEILSGRVGKELEKASFTWGVKLSLAWF